MIYNLDEVEFGGLFFLIVVFFLFFVCVKYGGGIYVVFFKFIMNVRFFN